MPRGYRSVVLAVCGWLALTGQHPHPPVKAEQPQADHRVGDALTNIAATYDKQAKGAEGAPESRPCKPGHDDRESDLCADWKAADAAEEAAWWAAVSGILSGIGFFGVVVAIGTALHSNWIARDTAKRELRAYLSVGPGGFFPWVDKPDQATLRIENFGQTPAYNVMVFDAFAIEKNINDFCPPQAFRYVGAASDRMIGPSDRIYSHRTLPVKLTHENLTDIGTRNAALVHFGRVVYQDAFKTERESKFSFYYSGADLTEESAHRCRLHNDAT